MTKKIGWTHLDFDFVSGDDDDDFLEFGDDDDDGFEDERPEISIKMPKMLMTPFGPHRVDDTLNPFRHFDFWMGSCNFSITQEIGKEILPEIDGIEKLLIISRYSFVIAVGKMFDSDDVKNKIEEELCGKAQVSLKLVQDDSMRQKILERYDELIKNKYWAMLVFPNGNMEEIYTEEINDDFNEKLASFRKSKDMSNGLLLCSNPEFTKDEDEDEE